MPPVHKAARNPEPHLVLLQGMPAHRGLMCGADDLVHFPGERLHAFGCATAQQGVLRQYDTETLRQHVQAFRRGRALCQPGTSQAFTRPPTCRLNTPQPIQPQAAAAAAALLPGRNVNATDWMHASSLHYAMLAQQASTGRGALPQGRIMQRSCHVPWLPCLRGSGTQPEAD